MEKGHALGLLNLKENELSRTAIEDAHKQAMRSIFLDLADGGVELQDELNKRRQAINQARDALLNTITEDTLSLCFENNTKVDELSLEEAQEIRVYASALMGTGEYYNRQDLKYTIDTIRKALLKETMHGVLSGHVDFKRISSSYQNIYASLDERFVENSELAAQLKRGLELNNVFLERVGSGEIAEYDFDDCKNTYISHLSNYDKEAFQKYGEWSSKEIWKHRWDEYSKYVDECVAKRDSINGSNSTRDFSVDSICSLQSSGKDESSKFLSQPDSESHKPVLSKWKTSLLFSIIGVFTTYIGIPVVSYFLSALTLAADGTLYEGAAFATLAGFALFLILFYLVLPIVYAQAFYPTYFDCKPRIRSSRLISFSNLAFGGIIFGSIWNSNLTNRKRGISHSVFTFLVIVGLVIGLFTALASWQGQVGSSSNSANTSGRNTQQNYVAAFNQPEQSMPSNGSTNYFTSKEGVDTAVFSIQVPQGENYYYILLRKFDAYQTKCVAVLIHPGEKVDIDVPFGTYKMLYQAGKKWYGSEYLFGPEAIIVAKADDTFTFNEKGGWEVELQAQVNGNLPTSDAKSEDFK